MNKSFRFDNTDLASRSNARAVRDNFLQKLGETHQLTLDLSKVQSISDSYADELFGILALKLGQDEFCKRVLLRNAQKHVYLSIARNILNRQRQHELDAA